MFHLLTVLLVLMAGSAKSQVNFPTDAHDLLPEVSPKALHECIASNGEGGACYEYRSAEFKECPFLPSIDTTDPDDDSHLRSNVCRNTGREAYFCCPFNNSQHNNVNSVLEINKDIKKDPSTCRFPFIYNEVSYSECTATGDPDGKLWCSTKTDTLNHHLKGNWKHCSLDEGLDVFPAEVIQTDAISTDVIPTDDIPADVILTDVIPTIKDCGISLSDNVVGGEEAGRAQFPWLAAIGTKTRTGFTPFCGGVLITKQHVISAAHCFRRIFRGTIVRLGEHNVYEDGDGAKDFEIKAKRRHKNYDFYTKKDDIILLKLDRPLDAYTDAIRAACLPYHLRNSYFEGTTLTVVGWGTYKNNSSEVAPVPLLGNVPVVPIQECQESYLKYQTSRSIRIDSRQLCAGTGGTDSCKGDSGGPINYFDFEKGRIYVVGLVSFGPTPCGTPDVPGVYARLGYYLDWIQENIMEML